MGIKLVFDNNVAVTATSPSITLQSWEIVEAQDNFGTFAKSNQFNPAWLSLSLASPINSQLYKVTLTNSNIDVPFDLRDFGNSGD